MIGGLASFYQISPLEVEQWYCSQFKKYYDVALEIQKKSQDGQAG